MTAVIDVAGRACRIPFDEAYSLYRRIQILPAGGALKPLPFCKSTSAHLLCQTGRASSLDTYRTRRRLGQDSIQGL